MGRNNIFELVSKKKNVSYELSKIDKILNDSSVITDWGNYANHISGVERSIVEYIDKYLFKKWKSRNYCFSSSEFMEKIGLSPLCWSKRINLNYVLNYCEYAANLIYLIKNKIYENDEFSDDVDIALENINMILSWYNFEIKEFPEEEKVLVVEKSAQATAVAEIIDEKLAYSVIDYNHFLLKGDIEKKKAILLSLGSDLESKREELKNIDEDLKKNIFFLLNNFNIRHNNCSPEDKSQYKEYVANLKNSELEKWYDELYQLILLAYLLLDNVERSKNVKDLRDKINAKQENDNGQT